MPIVLYQPEIPQNTGNIIRLCANTGSKLWLIEPLGFSLTDKHMRRAGLDYHEQACFEVVPSWSDFLCAVAPEKLYAFSTKAVANYASVQYTQNDYLLFGPETRGLPDDILFDQRVELVRIPMQRDSRSLNLSNAVAIALYENFRQMGFPNLR
ncbi:MAG: tRNA (cytidine(34)-2'-O)-methyltransferase [Pseudomonadota bacterium]|nr:tRNA (cytidine(34)-2'-O)-methyltransferase [Pseudomonadota bacterium]